MAIVRVRGFLLSCLVLCVVVLPAAPSAHQVPPEVVAFFNADGARLHVVVRVPTAILGDARLPVVNTVYLDLRSIDERLRVVAAEVTRNLDVMDQGRSTCPRTGFLDFDPSSRRIRFARLRTRRIASGSRRFRRTSYVYWNEAFADFPVRLRHCARFGAVVRSAEWAADGRRLLPDARDLSARSGRPRTFTVVGSPQRVLFEPTLTEAVTAFVGRAVDALVRERLLWLWVVCLAIPPRPLRDALRLFGIFAAALGRSRRCCCG